MYHYRVYVKCGSSAGSLTRSKGRWSALESRGASERARESLLLLAAHYCLVVTLKNYQSRLSPTWETKHVAATANLQAAKLQTTQEGLHAALCSNVHWENSSVLRLRFDNPRILLRCARVERLWRMRPARSEQCSANHRFWQWEIPPLQISEYVMLCGRGLEFGLNLWEQTAVKN